MSEKSGAVGRRALLFEGEFAGDDFLESDIGKRSAWPDLDHWSVSESKLTDALGDDVDEQLRIGNDLAGFLQELSRHNAQGVDGAGRFRRELQNRRRTGRNRAGKETRAEHRDDNETQKVGSLVAVSNDFCNTRELLQRLSQYPRRNWRRGNQRYYLADPGSPKPLTKVNGPDTTIATAYQPPRCQVSLRCFRAAKYLGERFTSGRWTAPLVL